MSRKKELGPPTADFGVSPAQPSPGDEVRLYDFSFDPGGVGISARRWDFGDGDTSSKSAPRHSFDGEGGYEVRLEVRTFDGRRSTVVRTVQVRPQARP